MATRLYSQSFPLTNAVTALSLGLGPKDALSIQSATVVNFDTVTRAFTANLFQAGGSIANSNLVESNKALSQNVSTNTSLSGKNVLPGGTIAAGIDSGTSCTLQISGIIVPQT